MFRDAYLKVCKAAEGKAALLENNLPGFFLSSMLAGMFIAFGAFVSTVMGALATEGGCTVTKLVMALVFASALSLVIMAGGELFTGNNMTMTAGALEKRVGWGTVVRLWVITWIGNLAGSWLAVILFRLSGAGSPEAVAALFASISAGKIGLTPLQMVIRGVLCNTCVCLAIWCSFKLETEIGKLVMAVWCILIFMICGFEHSVANMSTIGVALLNPMGENITVAGYCVNLLFVTIGNFIGGVVFVALPYWVISRQVKVRA